MSDYFMETVSVILIQYFTNVYNLANALWSTGADSQRMCILLTLKQRLREGIPALGQVTSYDFGYQHQKHPIADST